MHRLTLVLLALAACQPAPCPRETPTVITWSPGVQTATPVPGRTITVSGAAEILTAPDTFELTIGFDVLAPDLQRARDDSRQRAAALLDVVARHSIADSDVQTQELSLQPRYDNYEHRKIVGYEATRGLVVTLHDLGAVEPVLYDMLAAGANRVDRVQFHSSAAREKRAEARVLAVQAARAKAEAMAAALGQTLGEALRVEEVTVDAWRPPTLGNIALMNDTAPQISDTVATGRIRVQANVSVTFALAHQ
ncbi:SIMPL domain-containing protein [Nannocystis punicea]|uniref:SIMPL domain-containing protein n=1 Tax=Nannocystis punicea TaxID=2995304 RepID=A0ABY7GXY2_9BACT|nr:SIMPL domain-containing protein [Nannocystis poenicansa]WAS91729.1 SIMPL domain-containing protein [Nannocystis poenicansa]